MKAILVLALLATLSLISSAKVLVNRKSKPDTFKARQNDKLGLENDDTAVSETACKLPFVKTGFRTLGDFSADRNRFWRAAIQFSELPNDALLAGTSILKGVGCGGCFEITNKETREFIRVLNVDSPKGEAPIELGADAFFAISGESGTDLEVELIQVTAAFCATGEPIHPDSDSSS